MCLCARCFPQKSRYFGGNDPQCFFHCSTIIMHKWFGELGHFLQATASGDAVGSCTATQPYQPCVAKYQQQGGLKPFTGSVPYCHIHFSSPRESQTSPIRGGNCQRGELNYSGELTMLDLGDKKSELESLYLTKDQPI